MSSKKQNSTKDLNNKKTDSKQASVKEEKKDDSKSKKVDTTNKSDVKKADAKTDNKVSDKKVDEKSNSKVVDNSKKVEEKSKTNVDAKKNDDKTSSKKDVNTKEDKTKTDVKKQNDKDKDKSVTKTDVKKSDEKSSNLNDKTKNEERSKNDSKNEKINSKTEVKKVEDKDKSNVKKTDEKDSKKQNDINSTKSNLNLKKIEKNDNTSTNSKTKTNTNLIKNDPITTNKISSNNENKDKVNNTSKSLSKRVSVNELMASKERDLSLSIQKKKLQKSENITIKESRKLAETIDKDLIFKIKATCLIDYGAKKIEVEDNSNSIFSDFKKKIFEKAMIDEKKYSIFLANANITKMNTKILEEIFKSDRLPILSVREKVILDKPNVKKEVFKIAVENYPSVNEIGYFLNKFLQKNKLPLDYKEQIVSGKLIYTFEDPEVAFGFLKALNAEKFYNNLFSKIKSSLFSKENNTKIIRKPGLIPSGSINKLEHGGVFNTDHHDKSPKKSTLNTKFNRHFDDRVSLLL